MSQAAAIHPGNTSRDNRSVAIQRWGALIGGSALAIYGLTRRSASGIAIAGAGGALAYMGATASAQPQEIFARSSVQLNISAAEAYQFWRDFENLPLFMRRIESVSNLGSGRYRWLVLGPMGIRITWDTEITSERENELIAWRSLPGSDIYTEGVVEFRPASGNRGTQVTAVTRFIPPAGPTGRTLAKIMGKYPNFLMRQDLRRFKALVETGEIPTTEGQTHGPRSTTVAVLRLADPTRPLRPESRISEVLDALRRIA